MCKASCAELPGYMYTYKVISMVSKEEVWSTLKQVIDPEIGLSIVDLGLVYSVEVNNNEVNVKMTLTNPACPLQSYLKAQVEEAVSKLPNVKKAEVQLIFEPAWTPERMSHEARKKLGIGL